MELRSKKVSVIPFGGGVTVALSEGRGITDRRRLWNVVLENGYRKLRSGSYSINKLGRLSSGVGGVGDIVVRKSNL